MYPIRVCASPLCSSTIFIVANTFSFFPYRTISLVISVLTTSFMAAICLNHMLHL